MKLDSRINCKENRNQCDTGVIVETVRHLPCKELFWVWSKYPVRSHETAANDKARSKPEVQLDAAPKQTNKQAEIILSFSSLGGVS